MPAANPSLPLLLTLVTRTQAKSRPPMQPRFGNPISQRGFSRKKRNHTKYQKRFLSPAVPIVLIHVEQSGVRVCSSRYIRRSSVLLRFGSSTCIQKRVQLTCHIRFKVIFKVQRTINSFWDVPSAQPKVTLCCQAPSRNLHFSSLQKLDHLGISFTSGDQPSTYLTYTGPTNQPTNQPTTRRRIIFRCNPNVFTMRGSAEEWIIVNNNTSLAVNK
jgi:hypothetical protein